MLGGVGSIPKSKDGIGDNSRNDRRVGGRMSDPGQGCGAGGGMVGLGGSCGVDKGMVGLGDGREVGEGMVGLRDGCGVGIRMDVGWMERDQGYGQPEG